MPSALAWKDAMDDRRGPRDVATPIRGGLRGQTVTKTEQQTNDCHAKGAGEWQKDDPWQKGDPWKEAMDSRKPSSSAVTPRGRVQGQAAATDEHTVDSQSARNDEWHKDNPLQKDSLWKKAMDSRMPSRCALTQRGGIRGQAAAKDEQPADSQITSNDEWHKDDWQGSGTDWQTGGGGWDDDRWRSGFRSSNVERGSKSETTTAKSAPKIDTCSGAYKMLGRATPFASTREAWPKPAPAPAAGSSDSGYCGEAANAITSFSSVQMLANYLLADPARVEQRRKGLERMLLSEAGPVTVTFHGVDLNVALVDEAARLAKQQCLSKPPCGHVGSHVASSSQAPAAAVSVQAGRRRHTCEPCKVNSF
eukprot:gnl/TRDRNA2_/TRDRNA2_157782_c1_seq1.p1 gnl/TRDRNA2_/TRDRNA2_157782_c1~~gnl/TRDRNA2_/TRDRNA2_157782_c1_seq1.p1  ORF type:complete len:375 (+),score=64.96 gnl/TRDRNA2_/TRDRNA2_157782_c1_seq1:38-1126(+)